MRCLLLDDWKMNLLCISQTVANKVIVLYSRLPAVTIIYINIIHDIIYIYIQCVLR